MCFITTNDPFDMHVVSWSLVNLGTLIIAALRYIMELGAKNLVFDDAMLYFAVLFSSIGYPMKS